MKRGTKNFLKGSRAYLSGPMDFVASRAKEKKYGWRTRVSQLLKSYGVTVFDPWDKPEIRGLYEYGKEDVNTIKLREKWTFKKGKQGIRDRDECASAFWKTLHIDLRMVDISDFIIAYCPTNIYSVGTVHEIVVARQQHKPVLFVSPPITFPTLIELEKEVEPRPHLKKLLDRLKVKLPIKENRLGIPSLWYMPLVGSESFFDGFGFYKPKYQKKFGWLQPTDLDKKEIEHPPKRPLLPYIETIATGKLPSKWDPKLEKMIIDDDWLLMEKSLKIKENK